MFFITGATGNIGQEVVNELLRLGQPIRAAAINQEDAKRLPDGVEVAIFDFFDPATYRPALEGVQKIFLMRPPQITDMESTLNPFVDFAKNIGVQHIVFVSLLGVEENPRVPHYAAEQHIQSCGVAWTFLRPSFFMQNLSTTHKAEIRDRDEIYVPVGKARTSFIDARDIGAVAVRVLVEGDHQDKAYDLTGSQALDYYKAAEMFSEVLKRKITYRDPSIPAFVWYSLRQKRPLVFSLVMAMLYANTRKGLAEVITDDFPRLLGRPPITLRQFIEDYADVWKI